MKLENKKISMEFDQAGRLCKLNALSPTVAIPIDHCNLTEAFNIQLRDSDGNINTVSPQNDPTVKKIVDDKQNILIFTWNLQGEWGKMIVKGQVLLPDNATTASWTISIKNQTDSAIWQVAYPRISGLTKYEKDKTDWLTVPFGMGENIPAPVAFVNQQTKAVDSWARTQFGCFDFEGSPGDIAFSYPGMLTMQLLCYGNPETGGLYFAAHDGQALYKRFGMYADGDTHKHAAMALKQYPENRLEAGADFNAFYPCEIGAYQGDWWGASAIYREWALKQFWCAKGPVKERTEIPEWLKNTDLWYWNWQFNDQGAPRYVVSPIKYLKERFGCEMAFHWYGYTGMTHDNPYTYPHMYPHDPDVFDAVVKGVKELHDANVHVIPYINTRLWNENTRSFKNNDGVNHLVMDENGKISDSWHGIGHTVCPTSQKFQDVICKINNDLIDNCGMDGAYLDQVSSCYAVSCFNEDHNHAPGGHDHWCRGYRELLEKVRRDMRKRKADSIITSESVIECFIDLFDADLAREISDLNSSLGCFEALPVPLFHSVYHDYHITYGTVQTFKESNMPAFRFAEALSLVGGGQLMVSGFFPGDHEKEKFIPKLVYLEKLVNARMAARKWLNLGVWKPPLKINCEKMDLIVKEGQPGKKDIPVVLSGCYELDGQLCVVLVNHTAKEQTGNFMINLPEYGITKESSIVSIIHPELSEISRITDSFEYDFRLMPESIQILMIK